MNKTNAVNELAKLSLPEDGGISLSGRENRPDIDPRTLKEVVGREGFPSREQVETDIVSKKS